MVNVEKILTEVIWAIIKPFIYAYRWIKLFVTSVYDWMYYHEVFESIGIILALVTIGVIGAIMIIATGWNY